jgi:hypothetical protein
MVVEKDMGTERSWNDFGKGRQTFSENVCYTFFFNLEAGLLARSQYSEVPATGHLDLGFSWFPCV